MIAVNIYYTGTNGSARKFAKEMMESGTVQKIREEQGNIRYEYFYPVDDEETVLLIDCWENQEAIDVHHASEMMKVILTLREKYDLHMKVDRFTSDEIPKEDQGFIQKRNIYKCDHLLKTFSEKYLQKLLTKNWGAFRILVTFKEQKSNLSET